MNLKEIEAIKNVLIKNVLATCWNFADETADCDEYGCEINRRQQEAKAWYVPRTKA